MPQAFALVREASKRTIGLRHYDVQIIGGAALHHKNIAEMRTGEGKTLVATLPVYLNALLGHGVHLVTVGKGTQLMPSFCPKMFTSLRTLTGVIHNRCIPIWVDRGTPAASLGNEYERAEATAAEIIEQYRGVMRALPESRFLTVEPTWLAVERDREIWTPLFSLAATLRVDDATMNELTAASVDLSALRGVVRRMDVKDADENAKERSFAVRLVQDARQVIKAGETFVASADLVQRLHALPTGPWRSYQLTGLTEITAAQLFGAFGVEPKVGQIGKGRKDRKQARGYRAAEINAVKLG
jgi:hypothetical protein